MLAEGACGTLDKSPRQQRRAWENCITPPTSSCQGVNLTFHRSLEADLQNATIRAHQPSGFGTGKSYRPVAADTGQREPSVSLIGSPSRASVIGRDHHSVAEIVSGTVTGLTQVA